MANYGKREGKYPLWTEAEDASIRALYPEQSWEEIRAALPGRADGSIIARAYKLKVKRRKDKPWTEFEIALMRRIFPTAEPEEIERALPGRAYDSVARMATKHGVRRRMPATRRNRRQIHPVIAELRSIREQRKLTRGQVEKQIGYAEKQLFNWELAKMSPRLSQLVDWASALGFEIILKPKDSDIVLQPKALKEVEIAWPSKQRMMGSR